MIVDAGGREQRVSVLEEIIYVASSALVSGESV